MEEVAEINFKVNETCKDVKTIREKNGIESSSDSDNWFQLLIILFPLIVW